MVSTVSRWSSRCRPCVASHNGQLQYWPRWNRRTEQIASRKPLIDAHARRFTSTNANCRRLIDAAVPAVSSARRLLSYSPRASWLVDETGKLSRIDTSCSCRINPLDGTSGDHYRTEKTNTLRTISIVLNVTGQLAIRVIILSPYSTFYV